MNNRKRVIFSKLLTELLEKYGSNHEKVNQFIAKVFDYERDERLAMRFRALVGIKKMKEEGSW